MVEFVPATEDHAANLAVHMRAADRQEIWASSMATPFEALADAMRVTREPWAVVDDDECLCMFGVTPVGLVGGVGVPWLLASDGLLPHARELVRSSRRYIEAKREEFGVLVNHVDARNTESIKWLRWLGFEIHPAQPFGPFGLPFHKFEMRSGNV